MKQSWTTFRKNNKPPRKEGTAEGKEDGGNLSDLNCRKTGQIRELIQPEMQKKSAIGGLIYPVRTAEDREMGDSFNQNCRKTGRFGELIRK